MSDQTFNNEPQPPRSHTSADFNKPHIKDPSYRREKGGGGARTGALILSVVAILIAIGVGIFTWTIWQEIEVAKSTIQNKKDSVDQLIQQEADKFDAEIKARQAPLHAEIEAVNKKLAGFLGENKQALDAQKQTIRQEIDAAVAQAQAGVKAVLNQEKEHKLQWTLDETQYLIKLANLNLTLGTNYSQSLQLLQMAEEEVKNLSDPQLNPVRQALAEDITNLRAHPAVDLVGLVAKINSISDQIQNLTILPNKKTKSDAATTPAQNAVTEQKTWRDHVEQTMKNLRQLFVVQKIDGPVMPFLTPVQLVYLKENIRLKLSQAEWAALHQEPELYQSNLDLAKDWLNHYANHDRDTVKSLQAQITELEKVNVKPEWPVVLTSLSAMNKVLEATQQTAATGITNINATTTNTDTAESSDVATGNETGATNPAVSKNDTAAGASEDDNENDDSAASSQQISTTSPHTAASTAKQTNNPSSTAKLVKKPAAAAAPALPADGIEFDTPGEDAAANSAASTPTQSNASQDTAGLPAAGNAAASSSSASTPGGGQTTNTVRSKQLEQELPVTSTTQSTTNNTQPFEPALVGKPIKSSEQ